MFKYALVIGASTPGRGSLRPFFIFPLLPIPGYSPLNLTVERRGGRDIDKVGISESEEDDSLSLIGCGLGFSADRKGLDFFFF